MIRSLRTAEKAMQMEQVRIDALANNLANIDSTGFRGILTRVGEVGAPSSKPNLLDGLVQPQLEQTKPKALPKPVQGEDNWKPVNPLELYYATDNRAGPITATGRGTDVAILGRGFFAIETEAGERYTRGGSFTINNQKELTTPEGLKVLGTGGPIIISGDNFTMENDGRVMVNGAQVAQFKIIDFADPTKLEHQAGNMLKPGEDMEALPVPTEEIVLAQGHLEHSNVDPIDTLVAMIEAQRAFEIHSKILNSEDEMLSKSVNNLSRVGS